MAPYGKLSGSGFLQETTGNVGIVGGFVEIGGRRKLITLSLSSFVKIILKRISKSCASDAISGRLSKASSSRFKTVLACLGMETALEQLGL